MPEKERDKYIVVGTHLVSGERRFLRLGKKRHWWVKNHRYATHFPDLNALHSSRYSDIRMQSIRGQLAYDLNVVTNRWYRL